MDEQARPEENRASLLHGGLDLDEQSIADSREWQRLGTGLGEGGLWERWAGEEARLIKSTLTRKLRGGTNKKGTNALRASTATASKRSIGKCDFAFGGKRLRDRLGLAQSCRALHYCPC